MIKSKIDARERALELAVKTLRNGELAINILPVARAFEEYIIGSAELPEFQSDGDMIKAFLDVANNELEKSRERNNRDLEELIKTLNGLSAEMPCKTENE